MTRGFRREGWLSFDLQSLCHSLSVLISMVNQVPSITLINEATGRGRGPGSWKRRLACETGPACVGNLYEVFATVLVFLVPPDSHRQDRFASVDWVQPARVARPQDRPTPPDVLRWATMSGHRMCDRLMWMLRTCSFAAGAGFPILVMLSALLVDAADHPNAVGAA